MNKESSYCMSSDNRVVHVVYGSQTGNSEEIARTLLQKIQDAIAGSGSTCIVDCKPLNEWTTTYTQWNSERALVLVVCSTTGNGDAPVNACHFWRQFKKRSQPKDTLDNTRFAVMGLGDSNYDKFCNMGKQLNRRFGEMSSVPFRELCCVDEALGLEEQVDVYLEEIVPRVCRWLLRA